ncbi:MAG: DUF1559 domain-containing protein [Lacipirellulaceae bacterium]
MRSPSSSCRSAFTLVELLVVIAIIGVLVGLLLPAVQAAREAARRNSCQNNLKQQGLALQMHHDAKRQYPTGRNSTTQFGTSWAFRLLPFIEQEVLFDAYQTNQRVDSDENALAMRTPVEMYYCPSRRSPEADRDFDNNDQPSVVRGVAAGGDYAANAGWDVHFGLNGVLTSFEPCVVAGPMFTGSKIKDRYITDGLSQTLAAGDRHIPRNLVAEPGLEHHDAGDTAFFPADNPRTVMAGVLGGLAANADDDSSEKFGSEHPGIVQFVYLDGHVEAITTDADEEKLKKLAAFGDGQIIGDAI